ncbi:phenylacetate--CoA ligase [Streptomyces bathyalis]|uniref:Phenylacetate--CoA ligase n=1 Tax=Streptomyces bathyalis TaxID=2710756 RepID=A0A7T1WS90_9ACTN|nr:AMP-binding protein [Streptomyces bathyalis]QPP07359.1 phenylacetate--CoA ligase [Streptomyces bathyalis]
MAITSSEESATAHRDPAQHDRVLSPEVVRRLLDRMSDLPSLSHLYDKARSLPDPALGDLPVLTKDDFRTALPDTVLRARRRAHGSLVLGSGGTTSAPKLSLVPSGQMIEEIRTVWDPLSADDVLVNYDTPGRLCSSHAFFNALAHSSGAVSVPLGAIEDRQLPEWMGMVHRLGATALNATQSQIAHLLQTCVDAGITPGFRKLLWTGEPFGAAALDVVRRILPDAELYGCYGSTETWVIGHNGPGCAMDTFHLVPYQHVELDDGLIFVTNLHPECVNPVVRYRIGDRGEFTSCTCGRTEPALRVLGRDDPQMKFLSILVTPQEIEEAALKDPDVTGVQVALFDHGAPAERMELRVKVREGAQADEVEARVKETVLTQVYRMGYEVETEAPEAFWVRVTPRFSINERSQKTPLLVKDSPLD